MKQIKGGVTAAKGYEAASTAAGIKYQGRTDMALIYSQVPCVSAGTFTTNVVKAAPVKWDRQIVDSGAGVQAVVVNSGIANACTGEEGMGYCKETAEAAAKALNIDAAGVLVGSTGVIGMQLPMQKLVDGIHLILMDQPVVPFSWMRTIVISRKDFEESGIEIMTHEMAHIKARHSIDLLISEICILFHWFNPSVWLLRQELQNIHEYEADESVLNQGVDAKRYQLLLIKKAVGAQRFTSMANSFNHSSLKKRIAMMLKQKSSPWARLKYLYVLPLAALTVVAFARPEISHELEKISSVKISEIIPVQEKKEPKRNVEVETLARDSVVFEKDMQAIQEKVSAVMEKYQPEIDKAVEEAVKAANIDEIVSAEMAKHQAEIDKAVQAAIEAAKIDETIAAEMEKIQPEINRTIEEAMKAIDINEKAAKEASKVKSSFSGIVYIDGVESSKERMDNLNPDRIASMNVYKGNEAIAKFGEKGRNGVIEIKLKK